MDFRGRNGIVLMPLLLATLPRISRAAYPLPAPCPKETVLVEVFEPNGLPALRLQPDNFRAKSHGKPLQILKATPWSGPARVVLLFDLSGSETAEQNLTPIEKSVGLDIVRQAPADMPLAMAVFASRTEVVAPFSTGTAALENNVENLAVIAGRVPRNGRRTALYDATKFAVGMFGHPRPGDAICVISDGGDNASQVSRQQAELILLANRVRLFAVVLPEPRPPRDRTPEGERGPVVLSSLAESSGGARYVLRPSTAFELRLSPSVWPKTVFHVPPAFDLVMVRGYQMEIALPRALRKPERWNLEVVDPKGKADHQHIVAYPWLSPCEMKP